MTRTLRFTIPALLLGIMLVSVLSGRAAAQDPAAPDAPAGPGTYRVGGPGPAGGLVFCDKGVTSDGWRYLECAPTNQSSRMAWSVDGNDGAGAAGLCRSLDIGGCRDWFLPDKEQLALMLRTLKPRGLGNFPRYGYFWSSTPAGGASAWLEDCNTGYQFTARVDSELQVRAIRAF
jgi:hypothetical protein